VGCTSVVGPGKILPGYSYPFPQRSVTTDASLVIEHHHQIILPGFALISVTIKDFVACSLQTWTNKAAIVWSCLNPFLHSTMIDPFNAV
jgi:hypothetical protein